jgi:glucose-1-phosphate thymidylyltransferase
VSKGVILAGGEGTRMWPTTKLYAKSMVQVYDRPMIDYPLRTLKAMGCEDAVIVSSPRGLGLIAQHVGDGQAMEMDVTYRVQPEGTTIAEPIRKLKIEGVFPLILGDCYYDPALPKRDEATLFFKHYDHANEHSVWSPEADAIVEKPRVMDLGDRAIIGYYYDERIYDFVEEFESSGQRLDIVDIHNFYRARGVEFVEYEGFFSDMGTPDGLLRAANHEQARQ